MLSSSFYLMIERFGSFKAPSSKSAFEEEEEEDEDDEEFFFFD